MSEEGGTGQMPHHDSGNSNRPQHQQSSSSFLPEPFPTASTSHIHANANHNNSNTTNSNSNSNANHGGQTVKKNNGLHLHDAFGDNDSGVDYGPPNEFEDDDDDDDDVSMGENDTNTAVIVEGVQKSVLLNDQSMIQQGGHGNHSYGIIHNAAAPTNTNLLLQQMKQQQSSSQPNQQQLSIQSSPTSSAINDTANQSNNNIHDLISIEELEEEVALHELTLTSLTSKLSTLSSQITHQTSTCHLHRTQLQMLNGRKMVLRKKTEGSCKLVKELEKSIEWAVGRLEKAVAVDELNNTAAASSTSTAASTITSGTVGANAATNTGVQQGGEQADDQHVDEQQHQQQQQADQETTLKAKAEETNEGIQVQPIVVDEGMTQATAAAGDDGGLLAETDTTVCHTSAINNASTVLDDVAMNVVDAEKTKQNGAKIPIQTTDKQQQGSSSSSGGLGRRFQPPSRQSSFMSERGGTAERRTEGKKKQPQQQPLGGRFIPPAAAKRGTATATTAVEEDAAKVVPQQQSTTTTQNTTIIESSPHNIIVIPLKSSQQLQSSSHTIAWPSPKLVRKIHRESQSLPVNVPTFRTHPIGAASTILGGLDTVELIQEVMNCSVLERLLQRREEHQAEEEGQLACGWVRLRLGTTQQFTVGNSLPYYLQTKINNQYK